MRDFLKKLLGRGRELTGKTPAAPPRSVCAAETSSAKPRSGLPPSPTSPSPGGILGSPDAGQPNVDWTLWARDSFDRDTPAGEEAKGRGLVTGLELLWKKYLAEGIDDDGGATFTDFDLRWGARTMGETASVSVKVLDDEVEAGAARLRAWAKAEPALLHEVAAAHARLIASMRRLVQGLTGLEESIRLLKLAATSANVAAFERELSKL